MRRSYDKNREFCSGNILEVIIVAGMIFASLYFVQGLSPPTYPESTKTRSLTTRIDSALEMLDSTQDPTGEYSSLLVKCMEDSEDFYTEEDEAYQDFFWLRMSDFITPHYDFVTYVYNLSKMFINSSANESICKDKIESYYGSEYPPEVGLKTRVSRIFVADGYIKEVVIVTWYV